jgi:hypothetical protein
VASSTPFDTIITHQQSSLCPYGLIDREGDQPQTENGEGYLEAYIRWVAKAAPWKTFLTLTFKNEVEVDQAMKKWYRLVRYLNEAVFGQNYGRIVGHSYFSYVLGSEYQKRGVLHYHALVDRPIDYVRVHGSWNKMAGYALITKVKDVGKSVRYVVKYVLKDGDVLPHIITDKVRRMRPLQQFGWWIE